MLARLLATATLVIVSTAAFSADLAVQRLTWSGVRMELDNTTVLVDAVGRDLWGGAAPGGLIPVTADTDRRYALITHLHNDHFDEATLREVLGERGYVICHSSVATHVASRGLRVIPVEYFQPVSRGGFSFTAVPAADGFGDTQVSWVIAVADKRFFHGGDSLWHGNWESLGRQFGPIDVAFMPINGVRVAGPVEIQTGAVMTPEQAVDAARLLRAHELVPIHYGFSDPPGYVETTGALERLESYAAQRGLRIRILSPGETLEPGDSIGTN